MAYAWTRIAFGGDKEDKMPGDEVSASDFDSQEEYDNLVATRVIRNDPYPDDVATGESVKTALLRKANDQYAAAVAGDPSPFDREGMSLLSDDGTDDEPPTKQPWER